MIVPFTREIFQKLTPFSLILSVLLLFLYHGPITRRFIWSALLIFALGWLLEVTGVETGLLFGEYEYGNTLGIKILHTPLLIGLNWFMLVYCSMYLAGKYLDTPYFRAIVAAVIMVVYDFALEPSAIRLDMWTWEGGAVPLQNYLAWALLSFGLNYLAGYLKMVPRENKAAIPLYFIQLIFFVILDVWFMGEGIWGS